ncbi:MAG: nuclear transport factor 2 family protein [Ignavibacteriales bacterium]|nr:nuclear transport factor 2 family protein [Ignavibacteriales bacterium]
MKKHLVVSSVFLFLFLSNTSRAQTSQDSVQIKETCFNYLEGWYEGNAERMEKAIHPDLAKRIVRADPQGRQRLDQMSALTLIQFVRAGYGTKIPKEEQIKEFKILDIDGNNASVKTIAKGFYDYIHLAKYNGEWKIVNVLWDFKKN